MNVPDINEAIWITLGMSAILAFVSIWMELAFDRKFSVPIRAVFRTFGWFCTTLAAVMVTLVIANLSG